jgi:hypothetical protein
MPLMSYAGFPSNAYLCNSIYEGINEIKELEDAVIFPNPSTGKFQFTLNNILDEKIEITDVLGNIIMKSEIKNESVQLDLSDQSKGIYFVRISDEKGNLIVKKIVKE